MILRKRGKETVLLVYDLRVFSEDAIPAQTHHTKESLAKDATRHLAGALTTIHEDNGYLLNLKANLVGGELHLNLEAIALEANLVELDGLQHATLVALETSGSVVNLKARNDAHILRGKVRHQHATDRPVDHVDATDIA